MITRTGKTARGLILGSGLLLWALGAAVGQETADEPLTLEPLELEDEASSDAIDEPVPETVPPAEGAVDESATGGEDPLQLDLIEQTGERLVQLDIVLRPRGKQSPEMPDLSTEDLELILNGRRVTLRYVDRICQTQEQSVVESETTISRTTAASSVPSSPNPAAGTFVFFVEHSMLSIVGQVDTLEMLRRMIPELVRNGNRGMLVSSGRDVMQSQLTDDADELLAFLEEAAGTVAQWTEATYAQSEPERIEYVLFQKAISEAAGVAAALMYMGEEQLRTGRSFSRLAATIGFMGEMDPPKSVLYFADIARKRAGAQYADLFVDPRLDARADDGVFAYDRVTAAAAGLGVRMYTVSARGLMGPENTPRPGGVFSNPLTTGAQLAEGTMRSLAAETGGAWFRGGDAPGAIRRIVERIERDSSCFYLLSFEPVEQPEDEVLGVRVRFDPDSPRAAALDRAFRIDARGQLVVQSESKRKEALLLAAHVSSGVFDSEGGHASIIPLSWSDGRYEGMAQFMVTSDDLPPSLTGGVSWDVGLTHRARDRVLARVSRRVDGVPVDVPLVLERPLSFRSGESEVVCVGHENRFGFTVSTTLEAQWPDPGHEAAALTRFAVVQPRRALFVREAAGPDEEIVEARMGSVALGERPAEPERPTYLVGLACRDRGNRKTFRIERTLEGAEQVDFEPILWPHAPDERCIQLRDLIPEASLGEGEFRYRVQIWEDDSDRVRPLAEGERRFMVVRPAEVASAGAPAS